jgi:hypothetical protein
MSGRYGCFVGGQLLGEGCDTRQEAEEQASDARGDFPEMDVAVDVVTFQMLACVTDMQLTPHTRISATEWACDYCQGVTTIREEG